MNWLYQSIVESEEFYSFRIMKPDGEPKTDGNPTQQTALQNDQQRQEKSRKRGGKVRTVPLEEVRELE